MSEEECNELPIRPQDIINTIAGEIEARRQDDSEKVVMEDVEYEGWIEAPAEEGGADAEEPQRKKTVQGVKTPTKLEIELHEKTHLPFRTWCKSCVKGRGQASPHTRVERDDPGAPEVHIDYCFPRAGVTILGIRQCEWSNSIDMGPEERGNHIMDCRSFNQHVEL